MHVHKGLQRRVHLGLFSVLYHSAAILPHSRTICSTSTMPLVSKSRMPWSTAMKLPVRPTPALQCTTHGWLSSLLNSRAAWSIATTGSVSFGTVIWP